MYVGEIAGFRTGGNPVQQLVRRPPALYDTFLSPILFFFRLFPHLSIPAQMFTYNFSGFFRTIEGNGLGFDLSTDVF
jgi:hypothetical protein